MHDFLFEIFCLTVPKNFVGEQFCVSKNFGYRKNLCIRGGWGVSRFSVENFLSHGSEKFRWGTLRCIRKIRVSKNYVHQREGYHVLRQKPFVTQYQKNRWGTLRCFRKFRVSQNFMHKKGISLSSVEKILSHSANKVHRRTLLFRKNSGIGNFQAKEAEASRFCRNFLSHRTETKSFVKEPFCFPENFWYRKKIMDKRGYITIFSPNFYVSQCRKNSSASLQCFRKFGVSKNFMLNRGITFFRQNFLVSQCIFFAQLQIFWSTFANG